MAAPRWAGRRWVGALALLLLVPVACGGGDGGDGSDGEGAGGGGTEGTAPPGDDVGAGIGAAVASSAESLTGTWEGTYTCAQGETEMTLLLVDNAEGGAVTGFFAFGPPVDDPEGATGMFRVTGTHADGALTLEGLDWVEEPEGYFMLGVEAETPGEDTPDHLEGTVVGDGCSTFALDRSSSDPWYVGTWEGGYICGQGNTGMTLNISTTGGNTVEALYEFFPLHDNPDVPTGSYTMSGTWVDGGFSLEGVEWVEQPEGYLMVNITSDPSHAVGPHLLAGSVDDPSCEAFLLERIGEE